MKTYIDSSEPFFVPFDHEISLLRETCTAHALGMQNSQWNTAMDAISTTLYLMYDGPSLMSTLFKRQSIVGEADNFSTQLLRYIEINSFSINTARMILSSVKKIMKATAINSAFVDQIKLPRKKGQTKDQQAKDTSAAIPAKYRSNDHVNNVLTNWITELKSSSRNKNSKSISRIVYHWIALLRKLGVDIFTWDDNTSISTILGVKNLRCKILGSSQKLSASLKLQWSKLLLINVLKLDIDKSIFKLQPEDIQEKKYDDGSDHHRISPEELTAIHTAAAENVRDELIFMLMITTGLRIGGLSNIKLEHVVDKVGSDIIVKNNGRTIEKFNKWFTFKLSEDVRALIYTWVTQKRPATSSLYLFPGATSDNPMSTSNSRSIFKKIVNRAGLSGSHLHPHALRHTFAHMLLESGNSVESVSKIMGHTDSKTTSSFYLKESGVEAADRMNIPWLTKDERKKDVVPAFLNGSSAPSDEKKKRAKKKVKILKSIAESLLN